MPSLRGLGLWGIDELITYHYLEAELFRFCDLKPEKYWTMNKRQQADLIWRTSFVENAPVSEAARGVISVLHAFGLNTSASDLSEAREFFEAQELSAHIDRVFELAGMSEAVMTNDPLDPQEAQWWTGGAEPDPRFHPVMRLDRILNKWADHWRELESQGLRGGRQRVAESLCGSAAVLGGLGAADESGVHGGVAAGHVRISGRFGSCAFTSRCGSASVPRVRCAAILDDRRPLLSESAIAIGGRRGGPRRSARAGTSVRELSRQSIPDQRAKPLKSTRTVCVRAQVREPDAVRMLVVPEQSVDCRRDHAGAAGDVGDEFHSAAFRCACVGAGDLQVAQHAPNHHSDSDERVQSARSGWPRGNACGNSGGCYQAVPRQLREFHLVARDSSLAKHGRYGDLRGFLIGQRVRPRDARV